MGQPRVLVVGNCRTALGPLVGVSREGFLSRSHTARRSRRSGSTAAFAGETARPALAVPASRLVSMVYSAAAVHFCLERPPVLPRLLRHVELSNPPWPRARSGQPTRRRS